MDKELHKSIAHQRIGARKIFEVGPPYLNPPKEKPTTFTTLYMVDYVGVGDDLLCVRTNNDVETVLNSRDPDYVVALECFVRSIAIAPGFTIPECTHWGM